MKKRLFYISTSILVGVLTFFLLNHNAITKWLSYNLTGEIKSTTEVDHKDNSQPEEQLDHIQIPQIDVNAPVIYNSGVSEQEIIDNLNQGVVFYNNSDLPGTGGLSIYFGHSSNYPWRRGEYDTIFSLLPQINQSDQIKIYYSGQEYIYYVTDKDIISKKNWSALSRRQSKSSLALVTCWPLGTTWQRYVVWAEEITQQS